MTHPTSSLTPDFKHPFSLLSDEHRSKQLIQTAKQTQGIQKIGSYNCHIPRYSLTKMFATIDQIATELSPVGYATFLNKDKIKAAVEKIVKLPPPGVPCEFYNMSVTDVFTFDTEDGLTWTFHLTRVTWEREDKNTGATLYFGEIPNSLHY